MRMCVCLCLETSSSTLQNELIRGYAIEVHTSSSFCPHTLSTIWWLWTDRTKSEYCHTSNIQASVHSTLYILIPFEDCKLIGIKVAEGEGGTGGGRERKRERERERERIPRLKCHKYSFPIVAHSLWCGYEYDNDSQQGPYLKVCIIWSISMCSRRWTAARRARSDSWYSSWSRLNLWKNLKAAIKIELWH